jgi:hypothetical protein
MRIVDFVGTDIQYNNSSKSVSLSYKHGGNIAPALDFTPPVSDFFLSLRPGAPCTRLSQRA